MASSFSLSSVSNYFKKLTVLEIILIAIIIVYLISNIQMPKIFDEFVLSPLGMIIVIMVPFYIFLFVNPVIGVLSLFMAHKILSNAKNENNVIKTEILKHNSAQFNKAPEIVPQETVSDKHIETPNVATNTLEEDIVSIMAPIGRSDPINYIKTSYKPITLDDHSAATA